MPWAAEHVWTWFCELTATRRSNGFGGLEPIDHKEIAAWAALTGADPTPWEVRTLRRMDDASRFILSDRSETKAASGRDVDASDPEAMKRAFRMMGAKAG